MKIYYAHHIWKYNTDIEKYEIQLIKKYFPNDIIINPNGDLGYTENCGLTENEIMKICLATDYDSLIFSSMDNLVGHGVVDEVNKAFSLNKVVYYLNSNQIIKIRSINWNVINESRRIYAIPIINN